jgi:exodeoxyribonuclease V alpha subunit
MPQLRGAEPTSDFHFVERDEPETIAATLVRLVQERIPKRLGFDPIRDVQVLSPMNRGTLGVRELNMALQRVLNPTRNGEAAVERFGWRFQKGDKYSSDRGKRWVSRFAMTDRKGRNLYANGGEPRFPPTSTIT